MLHMSVSWKLIQHLQATSQLCCLICNLKPEDNKLQMHRRVAKLGHRVKVGVVYWSKPNYEVWVQRTYYCSQSLSVICCSAGNNLSDIAPVTLQMLQSCNKLLTHTMRKILLNCRHLVSISKNVVFYASLVVRIY